MKKRGANKNLPHRLLWVGTPKPVQSLLAPDQVCICPNRLEILDDTTLRDRATYLTKGFQFDTPLRIEPDFTSEQKDALRVSESLPPLSTPAVLSEAPRALVR